MDMADAALRLDRQLCFSVYAATRALEAAYRPLLAPFGLTYPQYLVLLVLLEEDRASVREIGARLHLDSGTLSPLLKRLEATGFVTRRRRASDERVVEIHLTAAGKRLERRLGQVPRALAACTGLTLPEIDRLRTELTTLTETLRIQPESETTA